MTYFLTKIYNMKSSTQKFLAFLLFILFMMILLLFTFYIYSDINNTNSHLRDRRILLGQLQKTASVKSQLKTNNFTGDIRKSLFLNGESNAVASANLQALISGIAIANDVTISSITDLPKQNRGDIELLGLKIILSGRLEDVNDVILEVETTTPPLLIEKIFIQSERKKNKLTEAKIAVNLEVFGAREPIIQKQEIDEK